MTVTDLRFDFWSGGWREGQEDVGPVEWLDVSGDCQRGMFCCAEGVMSVCWQL